MANAKGEVRFEVEGTAYRLVLDFNALCDLDEVMPGLMDGAAEVKMTPRTIRAVFAAGLGKHHPDMNERDAGDLIQALGVERAGEIVAEAFASSFGGGEGTASPQKARSSRGAGTAS